MRISLVLNEPPFGKERPRVTAVGKFAHAYTPSKTKEYEAKLQRCWQVQSGEKIPNGTPLSVKIVGYFPIPKSTSKKQAAMLDGTPHMKKCDADNLAKIVLDALNGLAYEDDNAVSHLEVVKVWSHIPRVEITITEVQN